jgi:predicted dehydrogenase
MTIKVSLLGIGNMGRNHLRVLSLLKDVEVVSVFDVNEVQLKKIAEQYKVPYTTDADEAISLADAVVIVTPTSTHYEYFLKCVGKVQNVFIEKPLADSLERGEEIKRLSIEHEMRVQCGFIERFNPVVKEMKRILATENVINSDFERTNRLSSRITDVDVVLDLMIHDIDLALYLNGPVKEVVAFGQKENGIVAFASALFHHENGALSRVLASRMTEKKIRSIQITTDKSYVDADLLRRELLIHQQSNTVQEADKPYVISSLEQQVQVLPQEALLTELQAFVGLCSGESVDIPDVEAGLNSLKISEQILSSIG